METKSQNLRAYLIDYMAEIDAMNLGHTYEYHCAQLQRWSDFSLLQYWITYNGVFDGGQEMLTELKRLTDEA